jgi:hypothetical protein
MKNILITISVAILIMVPPQSFAGGGGVDGATIWEQIVQESTALNSYATQALHYEQAIIQTENWVLALERNPLGVIAPNLQALIAGAQTIENLGHKIVVGAGSVEQNLINDFIHPQNQQFGVRFGVYENSAGAALQVSLDKSGLLRANQPTDATTITNLKTTLDQGAVGQVAATQAVGAISLQQLQEQQTLRDLLMTQHDAVNSDRLAERSKERDELLVKQLLNGTAVTQYEAF